MIFKAILISVIVVLASSLSDSGPNSAEVQAAESVIVAGEKITASDYSELAEALSAIDFTEPFQLDGTTIETEDELEDLIEQSEATAALLGFQESLASEVAEAENAINLITEQDPATYEEAADQLQDVADLLEDGEQFNVTSVQINGETYDQSSLEDLIAEDQDKADEITETQQDQAQKQEDLDEAVTQIEAFQASYYSENGKLYITQDELEDEIDLWQDLLSLMDQNDVVEIAGLNYTLDDVIDVINAEKTTLSYLEDNDLVQVLSDNEISYISEKEFEDVEDSQGHEQALNETASEIEEIVTNYYSNNGNLYITADNLSDELDLWNDLEDTLDAEDVVEIGGLPYDLAQVNNVINAEETTKDYLEDNDLVQVTNNDEIFYIPEETYEITPYVDSIETLLQAGTLNSTELFKLSQDFSTILDDIDEDETVVIAGVTYTYNDLKIVSQSYENQAEALEHEEQISKEANDITTILNNNNEYTTVDELENLLTQYQELLEVMDEDDSATIQGKTLSYEDVKNEISSLEQRIQAVGEGQLEFTDPEGETSVIKASVKDSQNLTSDDFEDIAQTIAESEQPVISTASASDTVNSSVGPLTQVVISDTQDTSFLQDPPQNVLVDNSQSTSSQNSLSFLQDLQPADASLERDPDQLPPDDPELGDEYYEGSTAHLILTSYISNQSGTGKVFRVDPDDFTDNTVLIQGLNSPKSVCFDKNHNFLYVVESNSIYMYQIKWDSDKFELANSVFTEVYSGSAENCKVDGYGNLYLVDSGSNSISRIVYSDLYYGLSNSASTLYSAGPKSPNIDLPVALDVIDSSEIYYLNSGDGLTAGTIVKASANVQELNEQDTQILYATGVDGLSIATNGEKLYYALQNGEIGVYNIEEKSQSVLIKQANFDKPTGICYGDSKIYVADNSKGALYSFEEEDTTLVVEIFLQAITGCYAVNTDFAGWLSVVGFILVVN